MNRFFSHLARTYEESGKLFHLSLDLTTRCDLSCQHCYVTARERSSLSPAKLLAVLEDARELGAVTLLLSGGDPFLYRRWQSVVEEAARLRMFTTIYTHGGYITASIARALKQALVVDVGVSVYAVNPLVHDAVTGVAGSLARTRKGILALVEQGMHVSIKTPVLLGLNDGEIEAVADWARALGPRNKVSHNVGLNITPCDDGSTGPCRFNVPIEKRVELVRNLRARIGASSTEPAGPALAERLQQPPCGAGTSSIRIGPDGFVTPCVEIDLRLGSVHNERLKDIWSRLQARRQEQGDIVLADFKTCVQCTYVERCTPCMGLAQKQGRGLTEPSELKCMSTWASALADQPDLERELPPPAGLRPISGKPREQ